MPKNCLSYPVEFVEDVFGASAKLAEIVGSAKVLLVADLNVVQRTENLGTRIGAYVKEHNLTLAGAPVVIAGGERVKMDNFQSATRIVDAALKADLTSGDYILALGGGTILDVAGWAAAQLKGGVKLLRLPTTPAAMLGCAFAETAALNTPLVKDALVVPSVPAAVLIDLAFATTVLDGVWRAGFSEAVRLAVAKDVKQLKKIQPLAEAYQRRDAAALAELVDLAFALRQKKGGTDFGLASAAELEPKSTWKLPHGYAVAIGTLIDLDREIAADERKADELVLVKAILAACGALDGARHSRHLPGVARFFED